MASLNKCSFIGNLGRDPKTKYMASGEAVTNITIACSESWKDKNTGEKKEATEWINISFFGKLAEIAGQYLKKGSKVFIEGKMKTRKYTDKDGVEKYSTSIQASELIMLDSKPQDVSQAPSAPAPRQAAPVQRTAQGAAPTTNFSDMDDDIPFLFNMNTVCDTMGTSKQLMRSRNGKGMHLLQNNKADC